MTTARDPVAAKARVIAGAFRAKGLGEVGDMIDYLADRADTAWDEPMLAEDRERYLRYQLARLQAEKTELLAMAAEQ